MKIRVLAFATAADALGADWCALEIEPGATIKTLKAQLQAAHPALGELWQRLAVAVDGEVQNDSFNLSEGVEVALLPPVSGGTQRPAGGGEVLTRQPLDAAALLAEVAAPDRGAALVFAGTVRNHHGDRPVLCIEYSAYDTMAATRLRRIESELQEQNPGLRVRILHRLGSVAVGEASVLIATAAAHRAACYEANRVALERLKAEVPIWKQEHYADGSSRWREEETLVSAEG